MPEQLRLFDAVSDTQTKKQQAIQKYLNRADKEAIACVTKYSPGRRKTEYYRLSYRVGRKVKHIHIKGGSIIAELATYRANKLQAMIDRGAELAEVIAAVRTFNGS